MNHLYVWLRLPEGGVLCAGEIRVADPDQKHGGYLRGEFRYNPDYLKHPDAFALDPLHLPLNTRIYSAERPRAGVHSVFEDSLPDDWGRSVLVRRFKLARGQQSPPSLLAALGADCLGALAYTQTQDEPILIRASAQHDLAALVAAAERYDDDPGDLSGDELALLFQAASSPGGARPKVVIEHGGTHWIGKLRSTRDEVDMVRVEAACLVLAQEAGLMIPEFRVERLGDRIVLLIRRFDISPQGGRIHVVSMQTLAGVEGYYVYGYVEMADIVRRVSVVPELDLPALYRQSVFNAFLGNTDDHLKNFAMLRDHRGWRMTPAYDLIPDVSLRREHVLHFGTAGQQPTSAAMLALARGFGISAKKAKGIMVDVAAAFATWKAVFESYEVSEKDIIRLRKDIERRRELLKVL